MSYFFVLIYNSRRIQPCVVYSSHYWYEILIFTMTGDRYELPLLMPPQGLLRAAVIRPSCLSQKRVPSRFEAEASNGPGGAKMPVA